MWNEAVNSMTLEEWQSTLQKYACVVSSVRAELLTVPDMLVIINYSANHVYVYYCYLHVWVYILMLVYKFVIIVYPGAFYINGTKKISSGQSVILVIGYTPFNTGGYT